MRLENKSKYTMWITYLRVHKTEDRYPQLLFQVNLDILKEVYLSELPSDISPCKTKIPPYRITNIGISFEMN